MTKFSELNIGPPAKRFVGDKIKMKKILGKPIKVHEYRIEKSKFAETGNGNRLKLQISIDNVQHIVFTSSVGLQEQILKVPESSLPIETVIKEENECYLFT